MKKYALLVFIFISMFTSCNIDEDSNIIFHLEVIAIDSVDIPEYFVFGETYEIFVTYTKPNSCYYFNDFLYEINGNERTIAVINTFYVNDSTTCEEEPEEVTVSFNFLVTGTETYLFKFYQGEVDGVDHYYIVEVPVEQ